ncbi:MAG: lanthionine synthetase LanC family protein [Bacteroidota bacterium]
MNEMQETIKHKIFNHTTEEWYAKIVEVSQQTESVADWLQILLFYINMYTVQREERTLTHIHSLMEKYQQHLQKTKGDCSFEKGKAGFLYVATRLFEIDTSRNFMEPAIVLLEDDLDNFIISPYTDNSLNTGRAGCLLVLNFYYAMTNDAKAKKWIASLTAQLMSQAQITDKGIFWKDRVEQLHGLLNFEYGNAGIGYAFLQLSEQDISYECIAVAKQIYKYQRQFWNENLGWKATKKGIENSKTYQLALEAIQQENTNYFRPLLDNLFIHVGVAKFTLHLWQKTDDETIKADFITYLERCKLLFEQTKTQLSAKKCVLLGTLFLEAARMLDNENFHSEAKTISEFIQEKLRQHNIDDLQDVVTMTQAAHFQLALDNADVSNAVVPKNTILNSNQETQTLPINSKENVLQNVFPRTLAYLKAHNEKLISEYLTQPLQEKAIFNFMVFIKKNLNQFEPIQKKQLSEILKLEISIQNLKKGIKNYAQLQAKNIHTYQTVQKIFNKTNEELKTYTLQLNPKAKKLTTAWNWELKQGKMAQENLQLPAATMNVYMLPYYTNLIKEYWQNPQNVVLEYFKKQQPIVTVLTQLKQFYQAQDAIFIDNFSQFVMAESTYVLENLEEILLKIIQEYMAIGLLEIVANTTKSN